MKANLIKISLFILGIFLIGMMIANSYLATMFFKLGAGNLFEKLDVVNQYALFEKLYLGAYSMITTTILLTLMLGLLIRTLLFKK